MSEYEGDSNKLSSGKYATYPRYNTKDNITYVKEIGYTPSFQEYYRMLMATINHLIYNTQHQN